MADLEVRGLRFHVQRLGAGERTVVFLHGLVMDNLSSWYFTLANPAARDADVVLYDLRGHGRSERPKTGYGLADHVADLAAVLDGLGIERRVALVGNSFGGLLALAFAAEFPDRVARLALVDPQVVDADWGSEMAGTLSLQGEDAIAMIVSRFSSWLGRHSERKRNKLALNARELIYGTSLVEDLRRSAVMTPDDMRRVRCPTLAVLGENSDIRARTEALLEHLPQLTVDVFAGCSHSVLWEQTGRLRERVLAWLAEGTG